MQDRIGVKGMPGSIPSSTFGSFNNERKKNKGIQMGHTKRQTVKYTYDF